MRHFLQNLVQIQAARTKISTAPFPALENGFACSALRASAFCAAPAEGAGSHASIAANKSASHVREMRRILPWRALIKTYSLAAIASLRKHAFPVHQCSLRKRDAH